MLLDHRLAEAGGDQVDALLAVEDALHVALVEHPLAARKAEGGSRDDGGLAVGSAAVSAQDPLAALEELREEPAELREALGRAPRRRGSGALRGSADAEARGPEPAQRMVERRLLAHLRVVGEERDHALAPAEHVFDEAMERLLGAHLDEDAGARRVECLEPLHELHGGRHLLAEQVDHLRNALGPRRVERAGRVGDERNRRRREAQAPQHGAQRLRRRCHDAGVEGVAHGERDRVHALRAERLHRALHGVARTADHRLAPAVDIRDHDVAAHRLEGAAHLLERGEDRGHPAVVRQMQVRHPPPASAHCLEGVGKGQGAGGHERAVLAEAVAHHEIRHQALGREQARERDVHGEDCGLGDLGVAQLALRALDGGGIRRIREQVVGERPVEQRRHHPIGFGEGLRDDRLALAQAPQHVRVLGALARVEEGHPGCGSAAAEDPLRAQGAPETRIVRIERPERALAACRQLSGVTEVDGETLRCAQRRLVGRGGPRGSARARLGDRRLEARPQGRDAGGAEDEGTARRRLRLGHREGARDDGLRHGDLRAPRREQPGHVLLEDGVVVRAAEPEGGDARAAHARRGPLPRLERRAHRKGRVSEVDARVRRVEVETRRQDLLVQGEDRLEETRGSGCALQMAEVRLDRAERDRPGPQPVPAEHRVERLDLDHVAHPGGRPVPFHEADALRGKTCGAPRPLDGQPLPGRVRRRDAPAPAVARAAHPAQHGVDAVAGALRVGEALEQEEGGALTHHEAVGPGRVGSRTRGRERADPAELDEGRGPHVAIDSAHEGGVELVLEEPPDGGVDGGQRRGARRIADEVGPVEVEEVGDAARHAVGELARHGVLGDSGKPLAHADLELLGDRPPGLLGQGREGGSLGQGAGVLGEEDAQRGQVVLVARHRRADHDGGALEVEGPFGMAVVL